MQKIITKYGLAAHLAIVATAPLFLSETAILWVASLAMVAILLEPSRVGSEMVHDARKRVARCIFRDPLFWVGLVLIVVAAVRALNSGVTLTYDAEESKWALSSPRAPVLPGCVDGLGLWHFTLAYMALVVVIGCRHALGRSARAAFSLMASFGGGAAVFCWLFAVRNDIQFLVREVSCLQTDPTYLGPTYGICWLLGMGALATVFEQRWWSSLPLAVVGVCGSALGLFVFSPPRLFVLYAASALLLLLYLFVYLRIKVSKTADFRCLVVWGMSMVFAVVLAMVVVPETVLQDKAEPFLTGGFLTNEFLAARQVLSRISFDVWRANPWLGTGLGSFNIDMNLLARPADWKVITALQSAPLNGYWLVLAERGVVGAFLLVVPLAMMLITYLRRLIGGLRALPHPLAWILPLLLAVVGVEMSLDGSPLQPQVLVPLLAAFAISANGFVKEKGRNV